ncbi:D-glycero-beta-D-manno-heptose 1-phosphate adenylyltransferase, partial [Candidatus Poribacteria bacterium]|nr:D-glycero-beta-D-manno-heptose 1-phosphate adenylyltransferase [Candidatus Poribacteria bacterium]
GGEYTIEQIVGHEFVLARGGRVISLPLVAGRSSTGIIERIRARFAGETG